ncbi:MAG: DUF3592 domain-containing protein [Pseudomonadota bacterium]|nr:DUF3592 domain-containing protein [Pseudomonadota bacterium]HJO35706.1 DUF3592 domain-containing protein [Gammaproteobacteria bacterium]
MASVTDTLRDRRRWLLLCLGAGFGALFLGVDAIVSQQQFFADYEPVVAEVMEAEVRQVAPGRFVPAVTYRYRLDDSIYRADRVLPEAAALGRRDAEALVARFTATPRVQAYVDRAAPRNAFLDDRRRFRGYALALLGIAGLASALWLSRVPAWRRAGTNTAGRPTPGASGVVVVLIWQLAGAVTWGHYLLQQPAPWPAPVLLLIALYVVAGLLLPWLAGRLFAGR